MPVQGTSRAVTGHEGVGGDGAAAFDRRRSGCCVPTRVDDTTATRRLVGMLARKGYGSSLAFSVVREELAASDRGSADDPADDPADD